MNKHVKWISGGVACLALALATSVLATGHEKNAAPAAAAPEAQAKAAEEVVASFGDTQIIAQEPVTLMFSHKVHVIAYGLECDACHPEVFKKKRGSAEASGDYTMEAFAKAHPHTELTDNAYFWIGQGYYAAGEYKKAAFRFEDVLIRFPESDKAPGALLKEGLSFLALARQGSPDATLDDARLALEQVIHDYPDSREAGVAKKELAKLAGK